MHTSVTISGCTKKGFEDQLHKNLRTIEECLFFALKETNLVKSIEEIKSLDYTKCGRTDKGVSAACNVFSMHLPVSARDEKLIIKRINSRLPEEIAVMGWAKVPNDFSARLSCKSRTYRYFFFEEGFDLTKMKIAAGYFIGEHDFRNLCKMKPEYEKNGSVRTIFECNINEVEVKGEQGDLEGRMKVCYLQITGSGFLWHMVRCVMAILKVVGRGKDVPELVKDMLDINNKTRILYTMDDPEGLILYDVEYEGVVFEDGDDNCKHSLQLWAAKMIQKKIMEVKIFESILGKYERSILGEKKKFAKVENAKSFKKIKFGK